MRLARAGGGRQASPMPADLSQRTAVAVAAEHRASRDDATRPGKECRLAARPGVGNHRRGAAARRGAARRAEARRFAGGPGRRRRRGRQPRRRVVRSGGGRPTTDPPRDGSAGEPTPPATGGILPSGLAPGGLAIVTLEGDDLNVRASPGLEAKRLKPPMPAGTRMLIVGGPVTVDDMDWYQVQTDGGFRTTSGGCRPARMERPGSPPPNRGAGANPTRPRWRVSAGSTSWPATAATRCGYGPGPRACGTRRTLREPAAGSVRTARVPSDMAPAVLPAAPVTLITDTGSEHDIVLAMPPDLAQALRKLPRQSPCSPATASSMDGPRVARCRARSATGEALIPDERAVTTCRLQFIVQEVAFRAPGAIPTSVPVARGASSRLQPFAPAEHHVPGTSKGSPSRCSQRSCTSRRSSPPAR